jgi:RecA-family ATPase
VTAWLIDAADLLAEPDPGPTPWLVDRLIVERAIVAAVGRWKTTKSYGLLDICISVATGRPAFGSLEIPEPGPVVFVNEESGRAALWRRLDARTGDRPGGTARSAAARRERPREAR